jgi:hypothetical protein
MEKMTKYRALVKQLLQARANLSPVSSNAGIEKLLLTDDEHGHYSGFRLNE